MQTADGQAAAFFPPDSLQPSTAATQIRLRLEPVSQPPEPPPGYAIRGNVYRLTATEEPTQAEVGIAKPYQLTIEVPPGAFDVLQLYDGANWQALQTNFESDRFPTVRLSALGMVAGTAHSGQATAQGSAFNALLAGVIIAVVAAGVGVTLLLARKFQPGPAPAVASAPRKRAKKGRPKSRSKR